MNEKNIIGEQRTQHFVESKEKIAKNSTNCIGIIKTLSPALVQKIAAGEVVERPFSVVKELVENALDASSTYIKIELEEGGKKRIRVSDNGSGMTREDLLVCFLPHTTSKIYDLKDLFTIKSLGFRGEALSSICAVAQVTIASCAKNKDSSSPSHVSSVSFDAYSIKIDAGVVGTVERVARDIGTTITVDNLFNSVPARKKFLKSDATELSHSVSFVEMISLAYPHVSFEFLHNGKSVLYAQACDSLKRMAQIYAIAPKLYDVLYTTEMLSIQGLISDPAITRSDKSGIVFFLNGRLIKNFALVQAVLEGYGSYLMVQKYPYCTIHIRVDPSKVDVNVHPRKDIVKFEHESDVYVSVLRAVRNSLATHMAARAVNNIEATQIPLPNTPISLPNTPSHTFKTSQEAKSLSEQNSPEIVQQSEISQLKNLKLCEGQNNHRSTYIPSQYSQQLLQKSSDTIYGKNVVTGKKSTDVALNADSSAGSNAGSDKDVKSDSASSSDSQFVYLGIVQRKFVLAEHSRGILVVDFHAAHERFNYERFSHAYNSKSIAIQKLLSPVPLAFTASQMIVYAKHAELLKQLGFDTEVFGEQTIIVRTIPEQIYGLVQPSFIAKMLEELESQGLTTHERKVHALLSSMACKASDRAGDDLSSERAKQIIRWVLTTDQVFSCPHGRPTFIIISYDELEKLFGRKG